MKTIKTVLALTLAAALANSWAEDDLSGYQMLYWAVGDRGDFNGNFDTAFLYAVDAGGEKTLIGGATKAGAGAADGMQIGGRTPGVGGLGGTAVATDISSVGHAGVSFYIELLNSAKMQDPSWADPTQPYVTMALTETWSYDALIALGAIEGYANNDSTGPHLTASGVWAPDNYMVPEPTSGLLLLLGLAGLALKRKRS